MINTNVRQLFKQISILLPVIVIIASCKKNTAPSGSLSPESRARDFIQPMLYPGESTNNIESKFGTPVDVYETGMQELSMTFYLPNWEHNSEAINAGVCGFTAFFTNGQLHVWDPVYVKINK